MIYDRAAREMTGAFGSHPSHQKAKQLTSSALTKAPLLRPSSGTLKWDPPNVTLEKSHKAALRLLGHAVPFAAAEPELLPISLLALP